MYRRLTTEELLPGLYRLCRLSGVDNLADVTAYQEGAYTRFDGSLSDDKAPVLVPDRSYVVERPSSGRDRYK
jgi:hypothetical protein